MVCFLTSCEHTLGKGTLRLHKGSTCADSLSVGGAVLSVIVVGYDGRGVRMATM